MLDALRSIAEHHPGFELLVDSGAFTAWRNGETISLDDYCRALEACPLKLWRYFTLDVIGDPQKTRDNYRELLRRGFHPVPIFTRGENPEMLEEYYATSDLVAIGGLVKTLNNRAYVNGIMPHVKGRPVHLLGFTKMTWIRVYKPYSVDATTWEEGGIFGLMPIYLGNGRMSAVKRTSLVRPPSPEIQAACQRLSIDWPALRKRESWSGLWTPARIGGALSWVALASDVAKNLGTRIFFALTTPGAATMVAKAFDTLAEKRAQGVTV
jgi:hypothetical protein